MRRRHVPALVALTAGSLVVSACSGGDLDVRSIGSSSGASTTSSSTSSSSAAVTSAAPSSTAPVLSVPSSGVATPNADGLTTAQPTPGDKFLPATCPLLVAGFDRLAQTEKRARLKPGPIPAITKKRESIGSLLDGLNGKLEASGTQKRKEQDGKTVPYGYACYSGVTDITAYLTLESVGIFYRQTKTSDNALVFGRTVKLRKTKYIAPAVISLVLGGGLSSSEIAKNGNPGLGQTDLTKRAKLVPLKGVVFVEWTLEE